MNSLLKVVGHDEERERDFDLRHGLALTPEQRVHVMLELSRRMMRLARQYAPRKTYRIIQRT